MQKTSSLDNKISNLFTEIAKLNEQFKKNKMGNAQTMQKKNAPNKAPNQRRPEKVEAYSVVGDLLRPVVSYPTTRWIPKDQAKCLVFILPLRRVVKPNGI